MEFIKNNWAKLSLVALSVAGAILTLVPLIMSPVFNFIAMSQILGITLFFLGLGLFAGLQLCTKTKLASSISFGVAGLLTLVFLSIGLAGFKPATIDAQGAAGNAYAYYKTSASDLERAKDNNVVENKAKLEYLLKVGTTPADMGGLQGAKAVLDAAASSYGTQPWDTILKSGLQSAGKTEAEATEAVAGIKTLVPESVTTVNAFIAAYSTIREGVTAKYTEVRLAVEQLEAKGVKFEDIDTAIKSAKTGAVAIELSYSVLILALGAVPAVVGARKSVTSLTTTVPSEN